MKLRIRDHRAPGVNDCFIGCGWVLCTYKSPGGRCGVRTSVTDEVVLTVCTVQSLFGLNSLIPVKTHLAVCLLCSTDRSLSINCINTVEMRLFYQEELSLHQLVVKLSQKYGKYLSFEVEKSLIFPGGIFRRLNLKCRRL